MIPKQFNHVRKFYRTNEEYYHTIHHIEKMFDIYFDHEKEFEKEFPNHSKKLLFNGIAYHDSFYIPGYKYNERMSAKIAYYDLFKEMTEYEVSIVERMILSTDINFPLDMLNIKDEERILHDLDWSRFLNYDTIVLDDEKILKEAQFLSGYTSDVVIKNQLKFYKYYKNKKIFLTETFKQYEDIVKDNMDKRINFYSQ